MGDVSTNIHGLLDYLYGATLIAMPWIFGYAELGGMGTIIPVALGVSVIFYSLFTDYEWGLFKMIDMRAHLIFDVMVGLTLLATWVFFGHFAETLWLPYIAAALFAIFGAAVTERQPRGERPWLRRVSRPA